MKAVLQEVYIAQETARDYAIYTALAEREAVPAFRRVLTELASIAKDQHAFWASRAPEAREVRPMIWPYVLMRRVFGLTLTAKYIVGRKSVRVEEYQSYCTSCSSREEYEAVEHFIERLHEVSDTIEEDRARFFSNIVLGFNDALIELTGALVGFSFALRDANLIVIGGLVTGISASLSMAASAYLQARHENEHSPTKAAVFTGLSYLGVALLLVMPFLFGFSTLVSLALMFGVVVIMISVVSFCSAILLARPFAVQFGEILVLSLGVAAIALVIGQVLHAFIGA